MKQIIVCVFGSTKFKEDFLKYNKFFTLNNAIVLMPGVFGHSGDHITDEQKKELDILHKHKIAKSDLVFIIDKNGYIGPSTREEIGFAKALGIEIAYMSDIEKGDN